MSAQERWDVALQILSGPLAGRGEQVYRGPIVRIGVNPGPGGVELTGYRGLDARQCTITAYSGGTAAISPVGTNQVRIAPHSNVNWKDIDPISGPAYLSNHCAIHIGPIGRGATLEFVECRKLGVWQSGDIRSEVGDVEASSTLGQRMAGAKGYGAGVGKGGIPAAYDARSVRNVGTSSIPPWFIGCLTLVMSLTAVLLVTIAIGGLYATREVRELGPVNDDYEYFRSVDLSTPPVMELSELEQPMYEFVMAPNMDAAGANQVGLEDPKKWDTKFFQYVTKSVEAHVKQKRFFGNLERKREEWAIVVKEMRRANLPEVFAAIPYQESRYKANLTSRVCAKGYWQFMPETAHRVDKLTSLEFRVKNCHLTGRSVNWSPEKLAPPFTRNSPYVEDGNCLIETCAIDDRPNLRKSTKAAIYTLGKAWNDPVIRASGAAVQATILSHNSGYDDGRFGRRKATNILPVIQRFNKKHGADQGPIFYGQNILCRDYIGNKECRRGSMLMPETQHYAYNIVAQHFLAVCYYAKEYGENPAFEPWRQWALDESYCSKFKIPSKTEARTW